VRRLVLVPVLIAALSAVAMLAPAAASASAVRVRSDVVLINQPARSICTGRTFTVGVWYQPSGGSRAYRVAVYGPRDTRFFYRTGRAPASHWVFWRIRAGRTGKYRIVYSGHWRNRTVWTTYKAITKAHRCH
jgi:hypothetical protein